MSDEKKDVAVVREQVSDMRFAVERIPLLVAAVWFLWAANGDLAPAMVLVPLAMTGLWLMMVGMWLYCRRILRRIERDVREGT